MLDFCCSSLRIRGGKLRSSKAEGAQVVVGREEVCPVAGTTIHRQGWQEYQLEQQNIEKEGNTKGMRHNKVQDILWFSF